MRRAFPALLRVPFRTVTEAERGRGLMRCVFAQQQGLALLLEHESHGLGALERSHRSRNFLMGYRLASEPGHRRAEWSAATCAPIKLSAGGAQACLPCGGKCRRAWTRIWLAASSLLRQPIGTIRTLFVQRADQAVRNLLGVPRFSGVQPQNGPCSRWRLPELVFHWSAVALHEWKSCWRARRRARN
jgi:hypothetical protein